MHPRGVAGAFCCPRPAAKPVENLTRFYGHDLVLLPSGPRYIDMSAWHRPEHNFFRATHRCMIVLPPQLRARPSPRLSTVERKIVGCQLVVVRNPSQSGH